jgi:hypothetical protein
MRYLSLFFVSIVITGCYAPLESVVMTDVVDEYVVLGRDTTPFVSQQHIAEETAVSGAMEFCASLGKEYKKKYVLTTGMMVGKFADATLHFKCVDKGMIQTESPKIPDKVLLSDKTFEDQLYLKLTNLKKLLDDGTITKDEFEKQKEKLLNQK